MDWDNLRYFLALAETGSLSRASEKLQVDHSTVARRIDTLEKELGIRLVERLSRSYRLTAEGERVRDRAKAVDSSIAEIARFANGVDPSPDRVVRVNGPPALVSRLLAQSLLPVQQEYPGLRIELVGEARDISLLQGEADIALRMERPKEKDIVARRLAVVAFGLYGSRDYLARCGDDVPNFIGHDATLDHVPQQQWLKIIMGDRRLSLQANDLGTMLTAVRAGLGLAVLPCIMARPYAELISVPTHLPPLTRDLWLLFHRDVGRAPAVRVVIDRIVQIVEGSRAAFLGESTPA